MLRGGGGRFRRRRRTRAPRRPGRTSARRWVHARHPQANARALAGLLAGEFGFTGDVDDYYSPRNALLSVVLARRWGLPITLAIVCVAVGEGLVVEAFGLNVPGHFLGRGGAGNALWTLEPTRLLPDSGADDVEAQGQLLVQFGRYREAADMIHAYLGSSVVGDDEAAGLARLSRRARAQLN